MKTAQEYISKIKANIIEVSTHDLLTAMLTPDVVIIDVREHEEFLLGHIEGAVNFPRGVLEMKIHEHPLVSHHCEWVLALNELAEKENCTVDALVTNLIFHYKKHQKTQ